MADVSYRLSSTGADGHGRDDARGRVHERDHGRGRDRDDGGAGVAAARADPR